MVQQRRPIQESVTPSQAESRAPGVETEQNIEFPSYQGMVATHDTCMDRYENAAEGTESLQVESAVDTWFAELNLFCLTLQMASMEAQANLVEALGDSSAAELLGDGMLQLALSTSVDLVGGGLIGALVSQNATLKPLEEELGGLVDGDGAAGVLAAPVPALTEDLATWGQQIELREASERLLVRRVVDELVASGASAEEISIRMTCGLPDIPELDAGALSMQLETALWAAWAEKDGWRAEGAGFGTMAPQSQLGEHVEVAGLRLSEAPRRARMEALGLDPDAFFAEHGAPALERATEQSATHNALFQNKAMP